MRARIYMTMIAVLVGCTTTEPTTTTDEQGVAELRIDAALIPGVSRVSVTSDGVSQDLPLNDATGTFDGTLFLSSGSHSLVARAFSDAALVGQSAPVSVGISPAAITRVVLRVLDVTGGAPQEFGPLLDSLVYPTTAQAGSPVTFTLSAVVPGGDPLTYAWSSSCADSTFSAPGAATTTWVKPDAGACTIVVNASVHGFTLVQSFVIAVFPAGTGLGAASVSAVFVSAPSMQLELPEVGCFVAPSGNASCPQSLASPDVTSYTAIVTSWGGSTPGTLELSDDCGGTFGTTTRNSDSATGFWLPPVAGGLCVLTAHAVSGDGVSSTFRAAIFTHAGTPATAPPPLLFANTSSCQLADPPASCGFASRGDFRFISISVSLPGGHPGTLTASDSCFGPLPVANYFSAFPFWNIPASAGSSCTMTVRATTLEGSSTEFSGTYTVF